MRPSRRACPLTTRPPSPLSTQPSRRPARSLARAVAPAARDRSPTNKDAPAPPPPTAATPDPALPSTSSRVLSTTRGPDYVKQRLMMDESHTEDIYLAARTREIRKHFPTALGVDDFLSRLEVALFSYGFTGENAIAMSNLCRDEITSGFKHKLDHVFGSSFNTNGLGGVLTCGVTGVKAGLSHSPISATSGKERYVFLSFPHIAIDCEGVVGEVVRPGRPDPSCACGALNAALIEIQADGLDAACSQPGRHDPLDPEYSILKQRLARRIRYEGLADQVAGLDLVAMTRVAERTITDDLEYLIKHAVAGRRADYAVITGVQIHSWGRQFKGDAPNIEYIAPSTVYTVVAGERTDLDLSSIPPLTPRQLKVLAAHEASDGGHEGGGSAHDGSHRRRLAAGGGATTVVEESKSHSVSRRRDIARFSKLLQENETLEVETAAQWPGWQTKVRARPSRGAGDSSCTLDETDT